MQYVVNIYFT